MKKVYYAIVEVMEVPDNATDKQIDELVMAKATENSNLGVAKECVWSYEDNLFCGDEKLWG